MGAFIEDFEIVLKVLAGNRDAFAELVRRYEGRVRGYCRSVIGEAAAADDAAQDVFIKAYQSLGSFKGNAAFGTWIYRIAANHCIDVLRRQKNRPESWESLLEKDGPRIEQLAAVQPERPESDSSELIAKILSHLSEGAREVLVLREMQGLSYQEMSEVLDCTLDAVKSRLKRARQELELKMRHLLEFKDV